MNVHYENLQFDWVKGHARDPSSNSMLLLTSSVYVPSFIILRLMVIELWRKQTDRQTYKTIAYSIPVKYLIIEDSDLEITKYSEVKELTTLPISRHFSQTTRNFSQGFSPTRRRVSHHCHIVA